MINGYNHQGLDIDLSSGKVSVFEIEDSVIEKYMGGRGLAVFYLSRELPPEVSGLASENIMVIAAGALGGSMTPSNARFSVAFKSPLTGTISSANSGGSWGVTFKKTGFDVALVRGKAAAPVYIHIHDGKAEIEECQSLWGTSIPELTDSLKQTHSRSTKVLGIGPAGENQVMFASLINENGHAVGRGGAGAVAGSKNLKAILVSGKKKFAPANSKLYQAGIEQASKLIKSMPVTSKALPQLGTPGLVQLIADHDMLPHKNFQDTAHQSSDISGITGETLRKEILTTSKSCLNCVISCTRRTKVGSKTGEGPEYETIGMLGANLGIYDIKEVALANYVCNETGMDTISLGNTIGLLMELNEKGLIDQSAADGMNIKFGATGILETLAEKTAFKRGIGGEIALGAKRLAEKYNAPELAMVVKGLELPAYDPRASYLQALGYATSPRGGCHLKGGYAINLGFFGGARQVDRFMVDTVSGHIVNLQDSGCVADFLGVCRFAFFSVSENELSRIYSGFTGLDVGPEDLQAVAKRIQNLERNFNINCGFTKKDDTLPERFFSEEIMIDNQMRSIDVKDHLGRMLTKYYEIRKWDDEGIPSTDDL